MALKPQPHAGSPGNGALYDMGHAAHLVHCPYSDLAHSERALRARNVASLCQSRLDLVPTSVMTEVQTYHVQRTELA
jgi:hypothetical protein